MKKQFFRVKQLADQAIMRAEKSDVMGEDLIDTERRVESLRTVCSALRKKLSDSLVCVSASSLPTQLSSVVSLGGLDALSDEMSKKVKKLPPYQMAAVMKEAAESLGSHTLLGGVFDNCAALETQLALERLEHEQQVQLVLLSESSCLRQLLDSQLPQLAKQRRQLSKLTLDMDSLKTRLQNVQRHHSSTSASSSAGCMTSSNITSLMTSPACASSTSGASSLPAVGAGHHSNSHYQMKVDGVRDELDAAQLKVQQHRDVLASDMLQLLCREPELAQLLLQLVKLQREYFTSCSQLLEATVTALEASFSSACTKPVYGLSLGEHLRITSREIATPLQLCVCRLLQLGLDEEGIFRIAGSSSRVRKLKSCLDSGASQLSQLADYCDSHVLADAIKCYLRQLPDPLMTAQLHHNWLQAISIQEEGERLQSLWCTLHQLPDTNRVNLRYLLKFLSHLCELQQVTRMSSHNLAIVMAPNLLWSCGSNDAGTTSEFDVLLTGKYAIIVEMLIDHCDWFFNEEVDFFAGLPRDEHESSPAEAVCVSGSTTSDIATEPGVNDPINDHIVTSDEVEPAAGACAASNNQPSTSAMGNVNMGTAKTHRRSRSSDQIISPEQTSSAGTHPGITYTTAAQIPARSSTLRRRKKTAPTPPIRLAGEAHKQSLRHSAEDGAVSGSPALSQRHLVVKFETERSVDCQASASKDVPPAGGESREVTSSVLNRAQSFSVSSASLGRATSPAAIVSSRGSTAPSINTAATPKVCLSDGATLDASPPPITEQIGTNSAPPIGGRSKPYVPERPKSLMVKKKPPRPSIMPATTDSGAGVCSRQANDRITNTDTTSSEPSGPIVASSDCVRGSRTAKLPLQHPTTPPPPPPC